MQQGAVQNRQDEFLFGRRHRRAGFVDRLMDRADAEGQSQPLAQEFLNPRPRPLLVAPPALAPPAAIRSVPPPSAGDPPRRDPPRPGCNGRRGRASRNSDGPPPTRSAPVAPDRPSAVRPPESRCRPPPAPAVGHSPRTCPGSGAVPHALGTPACGLPRAPRGFAGFAGRGDLRRFRRGRRPFRWLRLGSIVHRIGGV